MCPASPRLCAVTFDIPFCLLDVMSKIRAWYYLGSVKDISCIGELTIQVSDKLTYAIHSFEGECWSPCNTMNTGHRLVSCSTSLGELKKCIEFSLYSQCSNTAAFIATTCLPHLTKSLSLPDSFNSWTCVIVFHCYMTRKIPAVSCLDFYLNPLVLVLKRSLYYMPRHSENTTFLLNGAMETSFQLQTNHTCYSFSIFSNSYFSLHFY